MRLACKPLSAGCLIGLLIVGSNIAAALLAPVLAPYGEFDLVGSVWAAPDSANWLGLDNLGRDILSRLLFGGRTTIALAVAITLLSSMIGISLGIMAAIIGGALDATLSRINDVVMSVPTLISALIAITVLGASLPALIATIAILDSTRYFRLSRVVAVGIASMEYVEVARLRGESAWWILRREILPNALPPLVAEFGLRFCFAFLFIASLSFLGLGIEPPYADWGGMVRDNALAINFGSSAPLFPAAAIAQLTIGVNLVVDWFLSANSRSLRDRA